MAGSSLFEWLSIVIKWLLRIRCCCEETFGTLVVAPEWKEEKEVRLGN